MSFPLVEVLFLSLVAIWLLSIIGAMVFVPQYRAKMVRLIWWLGLGGGGVVIASALDLV